MRRVKFCLQLIIVLVVFLYTGCTPRALWQIVPPDGAVMGHDSAHGGSDGAATSLDVAKPLESDGGDSSDARNDASTMEAPDDALADLDRSDAMSASDVPQSDDASTVSQDGGVVPDASIGVPESVVSFLALPATFCSNRRLSLSDEWWRRMSQGARVWHICYQTPSRATSSHPLATGRSERVDVRVYHPSGGWRTVGSQLPPRTANPWTASFLALVQTGEAPRLNLFNQYAGGRELGAVDSPDGIAFPSVQGEVRLWEVAGTGEQTTVPLRPICWGRDRDQAGQPTFFLPDVRCTMQNRPWCEEERLYDCRDP